MLGPHTLQWNCSFTNIDKKNSLIKIKSKNKNKTIQLYQYIDLNPFRIKES